MITSKGRRRMSHAKFGTTIPEFVRRFREEAYLTQLELGEAIGVSAQYISNIEAGGYIKFPKSFCKKLLPHLDPDRQRFLNDMMVEMALKELEVEDDE
jgi:DNA-binding XRE family transcriptional regulator